MTDAFLSGSNFLILIYLTMIIDCFLFVIFFCSISVIFKSLSICLSFFTVVLVIVQANDFAADCSQSLYLNIIAKYHNKLSFTFMILSIDRHHYPFLQIPHYLRTITLINYSISLILPHHIVLQLIFN